MSLNCRAGDLAVVYRASCEAERSWIGTIIRVTHIEGRSDDGSLCWAYEGPRLMHARWGECTGVADDMLHPIRDQPGNEQFVVESRKSLPRKKPVTGPVTIDVRGEVVK